MKAHPAAELFPMLPAAELQALADDIAKRGQILPIVTFQGQILDGRNRFAACKLIGRRPWLEEWTGRGESPTAFVLSMNRHRRHLTPAQLAALAAEAEPLFAAEAKERMRIAGGTRGAPGQGKATSPDPGQQARDQAAAAVGASPRRVSDAKAVKAKAPEVFEQMKAGGLNVEQAKAAADAEPAVRAKVVEQAQRGEAPSAPEIRKRATVAHVETSEPWEPAAEVGVLSRIILDFVKEWPAGESLDPIQRLLVEWHERVSRMESRRAKGQAA